MHVPTPLVLFASSFAAVFLLGLQSLTVNRGLVQAAFINSLLIGCANLTLLRLGHAAEGWEMVGYVAGGPFGIVSSMKFFAWMRSRQTNATMTVRFVKDQPNKETT